MSERSKISIITASFRSEATIKDTLESVNVQTYPHIDHIIIDGASNDGTLDVVKAHGKRVVHVTSEPDKGIFDAYNKGLAVADGEIIGILNSDDFYASPQVIESVMRIFADVGVDAVYADLVYVDKNNTNKVVRHWKSKIYKTGDFSLGVHPAHPTLFLRKSVYARTGGFNTEFKLAGDVEYMMRVFQVYGVNSVYLPAVLIRMRTGGATGGSLNFILEQNKEVIMALENHGLKVSKFIFFLSKIVDRLMQRLRAPFVRMPGSAL